MKGLDWLSLGLFVWGTIMIIASFFAKSIPLSGEDSYAEREFRANAIPYNRNPKWFLIKTGLGLIACAIFFESMSLKIW
jgi:hypothetical protein